MLVLVIICITGNLKDCLTKKINSVKTSDYRITPKLNYHGTKAREKINGNCLKTVKVTFNHRKAVNIYIGYELTGSSSNDNDPTVRDPLFGAINLTKNADFDKCKYSGFGIGFDIHESFSFPGGGFGCNVINFGVDVSSSVHVDNKKRTF